MARAKRTDRAEARRRHRAEAAARAAGDDQREGIEPVTGEPAPAPAPARGRSAPDPASARGRSAPAPARPGIGTAFRTAFRPPDFRSDIAYLPRLLRHRSVLIPIAVSILATFLSLTQGAASQVIVLNPSPSPSVSASATASPSASTSPSASASASPSPTPSASASASPSGSASASASPPASPSASPGPSPSASPGTGGGSGNVLGSVGDLLFQFFVVPPPVAAAFITGFLAPRASYLAGLVVALVSVACLAIVAYAVPGIADSQRQAVISQALILSPASGALYAAAAAWYKRFLNLANPNRGRQPPSRRSNQRPLRSRSPQRRR